MADDNQEKLAQKYFEAYLHKDRKFVEDHLAEGFTFTSPQDDRIGRAVYFERCWPFTKIVAGIDILKHLKDGDEEFVLYEAQTLDGGKFRNMEHLTFENGKLKTVVVFFGHTVK
jgi:hypothetical protein